VGAGERKGIRELGPAWITAIAALIGALTTAGFIAGRTTSPATQSAPVTTSPTTAQTVSAPQSTTSSAPPVREPGVYWSGDLTLGATMSSMQKYSLDFNPPRYVDGRNMELSASSPALSMNGGGQLTEWQTDSTPGKPQCVTLTKNQGSSQTGRLVVGSYVCGKTIEGRPFRLHVARIEEFRMDIETTVWNP
jgi:hypothetical protein